MDGDEVTNSIDELEALVIDEPGAVDDLEAADLPPPVDQAEAARSAARVIVNWLERLFSIFSPGFRFDEQLKAAHGERLAPVLEKRGLAMAGPLAFAPELDAILYGAELVGAGVGSIRARSAKVKGDKEEAKKTQPSAADLSGGGSDGGQSGAFTTQ